MKKFLPMMAATVLLSACADQASPTAPAASRALEFAGGTFSAPIGTYWKEANKLWVYDMSPEVGVGAHFGTDQRFQQAGAAGMRFVRHTLYWDQTRPGAIDDAVAAAGRSGALLLVVVHNRGQCRERYADPYGELAAFMAAQAARHPSVRYWELFNEQDAPGWTNWFGGDAGTHDNGSPLCAVRGSASTEQQGYEYAQMLKRVYPAIKNANPDAYVVVGGLVGTDSWDFIRGIYRGGGKPYFDVMAIHTYGATPDEPVRVRGQTVVNLINGNGDRGRPLWNTEFGAGAGSYVSAWGFPHATGGDDGTVFDNYQRDWWRDAISIHRNNRIYQKMFGFALDATDNGAPPGSWLPAGRVAEDYGFGLLRANGTEARPTYTWLEANDPNASVQIRTRYETVRVSAPNKNPVGYSYTRSGTDVIISRVPVNSYTPTVIDFTTTTDCTLCQPQT